MDANEKKQDSATRRIPTKKTNGRPSARSTVQAGRPASKAAAAAKKKAEAAQDSGYQPYRQANQKKKAVRKSAVQKFFSKDNQVAAYFRSIGANRDSFAEDSEYARKRRSQQKAAAERKRERAQYFESPAVVYTRPASFNRDRLLVQLITMIAVVVALIVGLSVFFKVKTITVSGTEVYSAWSVREASGISEGDNLLTFGRARAAAKIKANLSYIKSVRIGIRLPDTVNIEVEEEKIAYAIQSDQGVWWLMTSEGKIVEMINSAVAKNRTQVLGVTLVSPEVNSIASATELLVSETAEGESTDTTEETVSMLVSGKQRLDAALEILQALEDNDIVGDAANVDVSRLDDIVVWYGTKYQVNLGDTTNLSYKVACMYDAILQMSEYQSGVLDVSFTVWPNQVGYTPFT